MTAPLPTPTRREAYEAIPSAVRIEIDHPEVVGAMADRALEVMTEIRAWRNERLIARREAIAAELVAHATVA